MKHRTPHRYRPINLAHREWPVGIETSRRNPGTNQLEFILSNGALFCVDDTYLHLNNSSQQTIVQLYMASIGYVWFPKFGEWRKTAESSFNAYTKSRGLTSKPGEAIRINELPDATPSRYQSAPLLTSCSISRQPQSKGMVTSMLRELRQYIADNRNLIFTVVLIAIVDAFFLDGALKSRLKNILTSFIDKAEEKLGKDLNGDGKIGS